MKKVPIPHMEQLKIQIGTPEGSQFMVIIQPMDYDWEKNVFIFAVGQVDILAEARKGNLMGNPPMIQPTIRKLN
jgi:hypothetical protein